MKTIRNWNDLRQFGILPLTGEACALSIRILCDLTPAGQQFIHRFFALPYNTPMSRAWNSEGTGSVMLPYSILPDLAAFCLLETGCEWAVAADFDIHGIEADDDKDRVAEWLETVDVKRRYIPLHGPKVGMSCVHQMSGRSA